MSRYRFDPDLIENYCADCRVKFLARQFAEKCERCVRKYAELREWVRARGEAK